MSNPRNSEVSCYILSAGRTGTVFLSCLIHELDPSIRVQHEPSPSRYLMMLGNLRNDWGVCRSATRRWSEVLQRKLHQGDGRYIEINPFLCSVADTLPIAGRKLNVLHVVRHPADWARSITTFKASAKLRGAIDYVPFAKPYPSPRPAGWGQLSDYERALWRWTWCNSQIDGLQKKASRYSRIRYEDLFSDNPETRLTALATLRWMFDLEKVLDANHPIFSSRLNPSPTQSKTANFAAEKEICGLLAASYGYEIGEN